MCIIIQKAELDRDRIRDENKQKKSRQRIPVGLCSGLQTYFRGVCYIYTVTYTSSVGDCHGEVVRM